MRILTFFLNWNTTYQMNLFLKTNFYQEGQDGYLVAFSGETMRCTLKLMIF